MDPTLTQLIAGIVQAHREIDRLQAELQARDQRIAELEAEKPEAADGSPA